jgi:2-phosphoglycolate phosphatase
VKIRGVLLDLDGTLADTAPDLVAVLSELLKRHERPRMPFAIARNEVSNGALGLIKLSFGHGLSVAALEELRLEFLEIYQRNVANKTIIFRSLLDILQDISREGRAWGIVTNKPAAMTDPLLQALGVADLPACVISGDRLAERKPHPAPLLLAADEIGIDAGACVYVGDAPRDIEAGIAAGMKTIAVTYGYIRPHQDPYSWGADVVVRRPRELQGALEQLEGL